MHAFMYGGGENTDSCRRDAAFLTSCVPYLRLVCASGLAEWNIRANGVLGATN